MAPLWLPRSVPSAWCVPAIEPRPQQTAQTILGSSCTRRQGCGGWCRAVRRVLALVALGVTSGYINVQAGGLGTLLRLRSMGVVLSCYGGGWLRCVLSQMHAVRVRMSGSFALQLPHVPCLCIWGHNYPTAHARGHPCCCLGRVDERNSARQRPAPGMEETWPAGAYYVCTKMSLRFLTLVRVCLC